jgi:formate dehydrogenase subunit delta
MSPDKLAYMANQIGRFFAYQPHEAAVAGIADHLKKYWEPRMRNQIVALLDKPDIGLDPQVRIAVESLRGP